MSVSLSEIQEPVAEQMKLFERKFREFMKSPVPLLDKITHYIVKRKGKQLRPLFVFLTAELNGGTTEASYRAASLIELLHTATLVHDDVVDDSMERRGFFSVNALWKNKIAVLVGDFLLSKGLLLSVDHEDYTLLRIVSNAVREMSEGELLQIEKARRMDITQEVYFEIIRQKTASLMASCCACGAFSAGADAATTEKMRHFGELTGMAFQIKDDLLDFADASQTGKPTGIDIKEKKMTLPVIYALGKAGRAEKNRMMDCIKNNNGDPEKINEVLTFVHASGGIAHAEKTMQTFKEQANEILLGFPSHPARTALVQLLNFTIERKK
ncbi:MAG: polyprenyl synthetase family protein [Bacteroidota bacterium]|jgi:octaprenyl-diphosphate synthase